MSDVNKLFLDTKTECTPEQSNAQLLFDMKLEKKKWENRRHMAWVSLAAIIGQTLLLILLPNSLLSNDKITVMKEPLTWAYWCESAVILAYMGFTTWAYISGKDKIPGNGQT